MITLSYMDLLLAALLIATIILVIYLIVLVKNLLPTVANLKTITDDASSICSTAKISMDDIGGIVTDFKSTAEKVDCSVGSVCSMIDGNSNTVSAVANLINSTASIASLLKKK